MLHQETRGAERQTFSRFQESSSVDCESRDRTLQGAVEQIPDDLVREMAEQLVKLQKTVSQDEIQAVQTMEVLLLQFINKVVDAFVVVQRQVHVNRNVQKTIETPQLQCIDDVVDVRVVLVWSCSLHWCTSWRRQLRSRSCRLVRKSLRFQRSGLSRALRLLRVSQLLGMEITSLSCEALCRTPDLTPSLTLKPKFKRETDLGFYTRPVLETSGDECVPLTEVRIVHGPNHLHVHVRRH